MARDIQDESEAAGGLATARLKGLEDPAESARVSLLVRAVQSGDPAALHELIAVLSPIVLHVSRALLGPNAPGIEGVVQESVVAVIEALPSWRAESTLLHFVVRIAARRATIAPQRRRTRFGWIDRLADRHRTRFAAASLRGDEPAGDRRRQFLRTIFGELPEGEAEAMVLRLSLGYSVEEIALITSRPSNTVRNSLRLAKDALRSRIEGDPDWPELWGGDVSRVGRVDLHPEELFDRARRGEASQREAERFQAHLGLCRACRLEYTLAHACAEGAAVLPDDEFVITRTRRAASLQLEHRAAFRGQTSISQPIAPWRIFLIAASILVSLATMIQATALARSAWRFAFPASSSATMDADQVEGSTAPSPPAPEQVRSWDVAPVADELFASANFAQRDGEIEEAMRLYTELQTAFPGSSEELVSRVIFGRLLLDRLDDAKGALAQFDSYLANAEQDTLREEALVGRALALERLYRHAEEKSGWEAFLREYPKSTHAGLARTRLDELR